MSHCSVCQSAETVPFIDAGVVPVQCTTLHSERNAARMAAMGKMVLVLCPRCATVTNSAFDDTLVTYDGDYENSQLFSPTFRAFASELAESLIVRHGLKGRPVVEVGSGKGEFLAMLAEAGAGRATGYDPTYGGEVDHLDASLDVHLVRAMFDQDSIEGRPGLVCARHVLEHVVDPVGMLRGIRTAVQEASTQRDSTCMLYVEVPNAAFTFTAAGLWDIIYQHCSYFSADSLGWVAAASGFDVVDLRSVFNGQFLAMEALPSGESLGPTWKGDVDATVLELGRFIESYQQVVGQWRERLESWRRSGRSVALWGAGAKGVTFLNLVGQEVDAVVDVNERKLGRFLPGTGHEVIAPAELAALRPDVLIVMNSAYEREIRSDLHRLGLHPEVAIA